MLFTIGLVVLLVLVVVLLFAYQKIYNPGKLCSVCYRVVPEQALQCPFCDSDIVIEAISKASDLEIERKKDEPVAPTTINIYESVINRSEIGNREKKEK